MERHESHVPASAGARPDARQGEGLGWGIFLVLVGIGLLADAMGWLPANTEWFLPVVLIAWGAAKIYSAAQRRR
jgi:hypothetical protein